MVVQLIQAPLRVDAVAARRVVRYPPLWATPEDTDTDSNGQSAASESHSQSHSHSRSHHGLEHQLEALKATLSKSSEERQRQFLAVRANTCLTNLQDVGPAPDDDGNVNVNVNYDVHNVDVVTIIPVKARPWREFLHQGLAVGQQISLVSLILCFHQHLLCSTGTSADDNNDNSYETSSCPNTRNNILNSDPQELQRMVNRYTLFGLGCVMLLLSVYYGGEEEGNHININVIISSTKENLKRRRQRATSRTVDAGRLALFLRLFASLLRSLTASYSPDTVGKLACYGMALHLLACDYKYACGKTIIPPKQGAGADANTATDADAPLSITRTTTTHSYYPFEHFQTTHSITHCRPKFLGGTVSLNAAFFAVILLASRLPSDSAAFMFVMVSIIVFAFYPDARHRIARNANNQHHKQHPNSNAVKGKGKMILMNELAEQSCAVLPFVLLLDACCLRHESTVDI
jgi:hypothetical protein